MSLAHTEEMGRGWRERERERERENSKTVILKDSIVMLGPFWTYLTASLCYTTNTKLIRTTILQRERETNRYDIIVSNLLI